MPHTLRQPKAIFFISTALFFCVVSVILFSANMQRGLSHDEHMYVAGGALLAQGYLPYRDFPYLQMPNLAFIYAALFTLSDYLLLTARIVSTVAALGSLAIIFGVVASWLHSCPYYARFIVAAGSVALIINNPIFSYTSGQAWNHDVSLLFCLAAFALQLRNASRGGSAKLTLLCGVMLGLAIGTRLIFVLALPVLALSIAMPQPLSHSGKQVRLLASFAGGVLLGLLPSLAMFALAPGGFLFGNLAYHEANAEFWRSIIYTRAMEPAGKIGYLWEVVTQPANLALVLGLLGVVSALMFTGAYRGWKRQRGLYLSLSLMLALLVGAFVPSPTWLQYFYAPLPFLVLCLVYCASALYRRAAWTLGLFALIVSLSFLYRPPSDPIENVFAPDKWVPIEAHRLGDQIKSYVGDGRVLTLAPMYPLEGKGAIYTDFAPGLFTWRSITLLSQGELTASGLMSKEEFSNAIDKEPPPAILTGLQADLEAPWVAFAVEREYRKIKLDEHLTLWLSP